MDNQQGKKKSLKGLIAVIIVLLLVVGAVALAFAMGYVYGGVKSPQETVSVRRVVCTEDIVKEYNRVSLQSATSQADIKRIETERAQAASKITSLADMQQDPTCLVVALNAAIDAGKIDQAKQYLTALKDLASKGVFANTAVYGIMSFQMFENQVASRSLGSSGQPTPSAGDASSKD